MLVPLAVVALVVAFFGPAADVSANGPAGPTFGPIVQLAAEPQAGFVSVSCISAGNCTAVGLSRYTAEATCEDGICSTRPTSQPLYAEQTNGVWGTPVEVTFAGSEGSAFNSVSCTGAADCTAVGTNSGTFQSFAVTKTNGIWGPAVEFNFFPDEEVLVPTVLSSVSCTSPGNCTAAGILFGGIPVYLSQTNGIWGTPDFIVDYGPLAFASISCVDAGYCNAVGRNPNGQPFGMTQTDGSWAAPVQIQSPGFIGHLFSVSCTTIDDCTAAGYMIGNDSSLAPLTATKANGTWDATTTPIETPLNLGFLQSVSCVTAGNCTAVGFGADSTAIYATQTNGEWGPAQVASYPVAARFWGVSCSSDGACTAVGTDGDAQPIAASTLPRPTVSVTTPADGAIYAVGQAIETDFTCTGVSSGSGSGSCVDQLGNVSGTALDTSVPGNFSFTATATSADGQTDTETVNYTVAAPPTVSITTPVDGSSYVLGEVVDADYSCAEGAFGPGLLSPGGCTGTLANGASIDTSTLGSHSLSVTATSQDGQITIQTVTYTVIYATGGFLSPISSAPTVNTGKAGRTYPVKWQLQTASGQYVSDLGAVFGITYEMTTCDTWSSGVSTPSTAAGGASLRYDVTNNQYTFNWATPSTPGCYQLSVALAGGQEVSAFFELQ